MHTLRQHSAYCRAHNALQVGLHGVVVQGHGSLHKQLIVLIRLLLQVCWDVAHVKGLPQRLRQHRPSQTRALDARQHKAGRDVVGGS